MQLLSAAEHLVTRTSSEHNLLHWDDDVANIEEQVKWSLQDDTTAESALDFLGLHAVEAALVRNALEDHFDADVMVNQAVYQTALEVFVCSPPTDCWDRVVAAGTLADIVPLRGDLLKVIGPDEEDDEIVIAELATPETAQMMYGRVRDRYREVHDIGRYQNLAGSYTLTIRAGLWMLKAAVVNAVRDGQVVLDGVDARRRVDGYLLGMT